MTVPPRDFSSGAVEVLLDGWSRDHDRLVAAVLGLFTALITELEPAGVLRREPFARRLEQFRDEVLQVRPRDPAYGLLANAIEVLRLAERPPEPANHQEALHIVRSRNRDAAVLAE